MMRSALFWLGTLLVFLVPNALVVHKETLTRHGRSVYLELAPVDPRSLMQGDYMDLAYRLARDLREASADWPDRGRLVLRLDEQGRGEFDRLELASEDLAPDEQVLRYRVRPRGLVIGAESFFFQEGQAQVFARAEYAELRVAADGSSVLVALCDNDLVRLGTPAQ